MYCSGSHWTALKCLSLCLLNYRMRIGIMRTYLASRCARMRSPTDCDRNPSRISRRAKRTRMSKSLPSIHLSLHISLLFFLGRFFPSLFPLFFYLPHISLFPFALFFSPLLFSPLLLSRGTSTSMSSGHPPSRSERCECPLRYRLRELQPLDRHVKTGM